MQSPPTLPKFETCAISLRKITEDDLNERDDYGNKMCHSLNNNTLTALVISLLNVNFSFSLIPTNALKF